MPRTDQRSSEALAYRKLYNSPQWRGPHGARQAQLRRQPLCENCLKHGRVTAATVVDHKQPHKGDLQLFFDPNNHQSLCDDPRWRCHSSDKQREEHGNTPRPHIDVQIENLVGDLRTALNALAKHFKLEGRKAA